MPVYPDFIEFNEIHFYVSVHRIATLRNLLTKQYEEIHREKKLSKLSLNKGYHYNRCKTICLRLLGYYEYRELDAHTCSCTHTGKQF